MKQKTKDGIADNILFVLTICVILPFIILISYFIISKIPASNYTSPLNNKPNSPEIFILPTTGAGAPIGGGMEIIVF